MIYNNFQGTFVRQIGHNNIKQSKICTYIRLIADGRVKHPDSNGEVQNCHSLNDDNRVSDSQNLVRL